MRCRIAILIIAGLFVIQSNCFAQSPKEQKDAEDYPNGQGDPQQELNLLEKKLEKALVINPEDVNSQFQLGEFYFYRGTIGVDITPEQMHQYQKKSEQAFLRVLEINPQNADAHNYLGQLYGTWGQHNSAILQFQKAVKINPQHNEAWLYLGMDYYRLGLLEESIRALENAQRSHKEGFSKKATELLAEVRSVQAGKK